MNSFHHIAKLSRNQAFHPRPMPMRLPFDIVSRRLRLAQTIHLNGAEELTGFREFDLISINSQRLTMHDSRGFHQPTTGLAPASLRNLTEIQAGEGSISIQGRGYLALADGRRRPCTCNRPLSIDRCVRLRKCLSLSCNRQPKSAPDARSGERAQRTGFIEERKEVLRRIGGEAIPIQKISELPP